MKKILTRTLIAALLLGMLTSGALCAQAASLSGIGYMYVGTSVQLGPTLRGAPVESLDWRSSDENIVTVASGVVQAKAAGRAVIAATNGKRTAYCGVVALPQEINLLSGESYDLAQAGGEKYYVENAEIADVNKKGVIYAKLPGSTRIGIAYGKQRMIVNLNVTGNGGEVVEQSAAAELDCANEATQIVLVDYKGGSEATLSVHEKQFGLWREIYACKAYVGRNGIGKEAEGDGKTPTGTYNLTQPFGIEADPGAKMNYTQVTDYHYWCGSSDSEFYNQLVDEHVIGRAPTSSDEHLIDYDGVYDYCMFIDYNAAGEADKGSCIFLHCKGNADSTAGCIAVSEDVMKNIIQWAEPGCKIVIR